MSTLLKSLLVLGLVGAGVAVAVLPFAQPPVLTSRAGSEQVAAPRQAAVGQAVAPAQAGAFPGEGWYAVGSPAESATGQGKRPPDEYYLTPDLDPVTGQPLPDPVSGKPPTNAFWHRCMKDRAVKIAGPGTLSPAQARDAWFAQFGLP